MEQQLRDAALREAQQRARLFQFWTAADREVKDLIERALTEASRGAAQLQLPEIPRSRGGFPSSSHENPRY